MRNWADLRALYALTLRRPRDAARVVLGLNWPVQALWLAAGAVAAIGSVLSALGRMIVPPPPEMAELIAQVSPVAFALFAFGAMALSAVALTQAGRFLRGRARFGDMFALVIWLQVMLLGIEAVLLLVMLASPALAGFAVLIAYGAGLVWLVLFVQVAHGFDSPAPALGALVLALVMVALLVQILFSLGGPV